MEIKLNKKNLNMAFSKLNLFLLIFLINYNLKNCQIYDDFTRGTLETGNFNLIDVTSP